jgi:hypothetical protein
MLVKLHSLQLNVLLYNKWFNFLDIGYILGLSFKHIGHLFFTFNDYSIQLPQKWLSQVTQPLGNVTTFKQILHIK